MNLNMKPRKLSIVYKYRCIGGFKGTDGKKGESLVRTLHYLDKKRSHILGKDLRYLNHRNHDQRS